LIIKRIKDDNKPLKDREITEKTLFALFDKHENLNVSLIPFEIKLNVYLKFNSLFLHITLFKLNKLLEVLIEID
jgi:hypothetical protein